MPKSSRRSAHKELYIVTSFGCCYKLTRSKYLKMLRRIASNVDINLDDLGTRLSTRVLNITDISPDDAVAALDEELAKT